MEHHLVNVVELKEIKGDPISSSRYDNLLARNMFHGTLKITILILGSEDILLLHLLPFLL